MTFSTSAEVLRSLLKAGGGLISRPLRTIFSLLDVMVGGVLARRRSGCKRNWARVSGTVRGGVVIRTYEYSSKEKETSNFEEGYLVFISCRVQDVGTWLAHRELCHARSISVDEKDFSDIFLPAHDRSVPCMRDDINEEKRPLKILG